jgi:large subunit ribosomal protein L9
MKIIFLKDVKGVGKKGEIKEINDGYARNFFIAKGLGAQATSGVINKVDKEQSEKREANKRKVQSLKKIAESMKNATLHFSLKAGEKGELFGSVSTKDIEKDIVKYDAHDARAILDHPIKSLGEHKVTIDLGEGITTEILVEVKKEN